MRVLVVTGDSTDRVRRFGGDDPRAPRLPQAYPFLGGLKDRGCTVELATMNGYGIPRLAWRLRQFDAAVAWGLAGPVLALAAAPLALSRRVCTFLYAHGTPRLHCLARHARELVTRRGLQLGGTAMYMTARQAAEATARFGMHRRRVAHCPVGVDTTFFAPLPAHQDVPVRSDLAAFAAAAYVVVAGDQLRDDARIAELLADTGLRLVRLSQGPQSEAFWRQWQGAHPGRLAVFCCARMGFEEVRYTYQHALCVLNLVDNSWQPAGWTVATEAMACGAPVIMNRGLTTEELARYAEDQAASPLIEVDSLGDAAGVREALQRLRCDRAHARRLAHSGRMLVERHLDVSRTADAVFQALAQQVGGRP